MINKGQSHNEKQSWAAYSIHSPAELHTAAGQSQRRWIFILAKQNVHLHGPLVSPKSS